MEGFQMIFLIEISMLSGQLLIENQRNIYAPKKKWKFFDKLFFLTEELEKAEKVKFDLEDRETFDFFDSNPALWNHHLMEYRDWNLRNSLLVEKLLWKV